jgi:hypothetical protein
VLKRTRERPKKKKEKKKVIVSDDLGNMTSKPGSVPIPITPKGVYLAKTP